MSYILLTYSLSITWLLLAFVKYKRSESQEENYIKIEKISIISALLIKPLFFTAIAWGLNTLEGQLGFWLIGGGHLVIGLYCTSNLYLSNKKQALLISEQV